MTRSFAHYPFGESWYETGTANKWKFTSYERDSESLLDNAVFRYDSSKWGRFMSPDPIAGTIADPQSMDRYSYVGNDPINFLDPLGLRKCLRPGGVVIECPPQPPPGPDGPPQVGGRDSTMGPCNTFMIDGWCQDKYIIELIGGDTERNCIPRRWLPWNVRLGLAAMSFASKVSGVTYFLGVQGSVAVTNNVSGGSYGFSGVWATDPQGNQGLVYSLTGAGTIGTAGGSIGLHVGGATYTNIRGFRGASYGWEAGAGHGLIVGGGTNSNSSGQAMFANISFAFGKTFDWSPKTVSNGLIILRICKD